MAWNINNLTKPESQAALAVAITDVLGYVNGIHSALAELAAAIRSSGALTGAAEADVERAMAELDTTRETAFNSLELFADRILDE
jgi:hypothetical protein